jgi:hypothetical protein
MTRLNLTETCLLEVSGELGESARGQLREHIATIPAAKLEFEVIKGQFELLQSLPKPVLSESQKREIASSIKQGIHRKLRQIEHQEQARNRWKLIYRAMAGVSAIAACGVIVFTLFYVDSSMKHDRQQARIDSIQNAIDAMTAVEQENSFGQSIRDVAAGIDELEKGSPTLVGVQSQEMSNLLEALSNMPQEEEAPKVLPGSL